MNKYYEKNLTTGVVTTNYYLGSRLIATREDSTLNYVHQDSLGSSSVTTNSSGTSTGSIKYFSFGQTRSGTVTTPQKFTGQRLDSTGLYYYGARYYDPAIGRFISADTIVPSPANPQSLNRYSYCLNNPLKYIDPSGHDQIITSTGTSVNGQEGYFICDGKGNLLGVAYGLDDLAAKSSALESQSRGVDLPVTKTTVDTNEPQPAKAPDTIQSETKSISDVDFVTIGIDCAAVVGDAIGCIPTPPTLIGGWIVGSAASVTGTVRTFQSFNKGDANGLDLTISGITTLGGFIPGYGLLFSVGQLGYDIWRTGLWDFIISPWNYSFGNKQ